MGVRTYQISLGHLLASVLLVAAVSACAPKPPEKTFIQDCVLPADQAKTLAGRWALAPIPLALQGGKYSAEEVAAIQAAADTWNEFSGSVLKVSLVDYGTKEAYKTDSSTGPAAPGSCGQKILLDLGDGPIFRGSVIIFKQRTWPATYPEGAIALTSQCGRTQNGLNSYYASTIEVNYQNFFVPGKKAPDLQSIITHELGHLVGLDHSCVGGKVAGKPNCNSGALDPAYSEAVMFPVFYFDSQGHGETKRDLTSNDQGRANCLYATPGQ